jgi:hypothetical protein
VVVVDEGCVGFGVGVARRLIVLLLDAEALLPVEVVVVRQLAGLQLFQQLPAEEKEDLLTVEAFAEWMEEQLGLCEPEAGDVDLEVADDDGLILYESVNVGMDVVGAEAGIVVD